jgi:hypothetical protein
MAFADGSQAPLRLSVARLNHSGPAFPHDDYRVRATNRPDREDFPTAIAPWYAPAVIRVLLKKCAAQFRKAVPLFYYGYGCRLQPWLSLVKP